MRNAVRRASATRKSIYLTCVKESARIFALSSVGLSSPSLRGDSDLVLHLISMGCNFDKTFAVCPVARLAVSRRIHFSDYIARFAHRLCLPVLLRVVPIYPSCLLMERDFENWRKNVDLFNESK